MSDDDAIAPSIEGALSAKRGRDALRGHAGSKSLLRACAAFAELERLRKLDEI
jgi:hypothetical protein